MAHGFFPISSNLAHQTPSISFLSVHFLHFLEELLHYLFCHGDLVLITHPFCVYVSVCKWPAAEKPCNSLYENSSGFFLYDKGGEFLSFLVKLLAVLWNKKALCIFCILHMCFYTYIILECIIKTFVKACFTFTGKTKINLCRLWHLWMFSGIGLVLLFFFFLLLLPVQGNGKWNVFNCQKKKIF